MRFSKKTLAFAVLGAAYVASAVLVCRRAEKDHGDSGLITIRFSQWQLETGVRQAVDAVIRRYEEIHPNVRVVQIAVPGGAGGAMYTTWVLTQMAGGTGPDLVQYDWLHPDVPRYFQPITADLDRPNPYDRGTPLEGKRWRDTAVDGMRGNFDPTYHEYFSVPLDVHLDRILYNRRLLKEITGSDASPGTYREMLAVCQQIKKYGRAHGKNLVPLGLTPDTSVGLTWFMSIDMDNRMIQRIDYEHRLIVGPDDLGEYYLRGDWSFDTPEAAAALAEIKSLAEMGTPGFWGRERDEAVTDFVTGRSVMFVAPSWEATNLLGLCDFPLGVFRFPYPREDDPEFGPLVRGPYSDGQIAPGMHVYVSRATRHRAEAVDFLQFITSPEGGEIFSRVSNWQSATIGVKRTPFEEQFKLISKGYCLNGNLMIPASRSDSEFFIRTHLPDLWGDTGTVKGLQHTLRDGLGSQIREDLRNEAVTSVDELRRVDLDAAAAVALSPAGRAPEVAPLLGVNNEAILYQLQTVVAHGTSVGVSEPGVTSPPLSDFGPPRGISPSSAAPAAGDPSVTAGWQAIADNLVRPALQSFAQAAGASGPVGREARLGRGVALLAQQPAFAAQVEEASGILKTLAESGDDAAANAARFYLGRIAQHYRPAPDPREAIAQFSRLITGDPGSIWAQTALARLALAEIYGLDGESTPQARISWAEKLLPWARTPSAKSELNLVIAYAVFFYRLDPAEALPPLLAVAALDRVDQILRTDVLVQIAELSRLGGDTAQAARYYHQYLDENPIDVRRYLVEQHLAALQP